MLINENTGLKRKNREVIGSTRLIRSRRLKSSKFDRGRGRGFILADMMTVIDCIPALNWSGFLLRLV